MIEQKSPVINHHSLLDRRYRKFPGWVKLILIRKVEDIAAIGIAKKNKPDRFEEAFADLPRSLWHVFTDPDECRRIVEEAVAADDAS